MSKIFGRRRTALNALRDESVYPNLTWTELKTPSSAEEFLQSREETRHEN